LETLHFNYNPHLKKAMKTYYFNSLKIRLLWLFELLVFIFCMTVAVMTDSMMLVFISIGLLIILVLNYVRHVIFVPNKLLKDKNYIHDVGITFNASEFELKIENAVSKVNWSFFVKLWENDRYYFLFHNKRQYWFIPKAAFQNAEQEQLFRSIAQSHQRIATGVIR
jgi:hypothetical protein